jgi:hypothetical protein
MIGQYLSHTNENTTLAVFCKKKELELLSSKKFCKMGIVALSFIFDKYCPIID